MKKRPGSFLRHFHAPFFTPRGFLLRAVYLAVLFLACHLAGLREYTSIISLTVPDGAFRGVALVLGAFYLLVYFAFLVAAPILAIAAPIFGLLDRLLASRNPGRERVS